MKFADLNDDCVRVIFDYLPSSQLFAICTSCDLKKQQIHRCAIDLLIRTRAPFRIKPSFARPSQQTHAAPQATSRTARSRTWLPTPPDVQACWLLDAENQRVAKIKLPQLFRLSSLSEQVRDLELPIELLVDADTNLADFWLDLASCLPKSVAISAFVRDPSSGSFLNTSANGLAERLRDNADKFRPIFPRIRSFGVPAARWLEPLRPSDLFAVLDEMPGLVSLNVPLSLFSSSSSAFSSSLVAQRLSELRLDMPWNYAPCSCLQILESIANAGCLNLASLQFTCDRLHGNVPAGRSLECVRKLPQLRQLAVCSGCGLAHTASNAPILSLSELHMTIDERIPCIRPGKLASFLCQFAQLRSVRISLNNSDMVLCPPYHQLRALFSVASIRMHLRELAVDSDDSPIMLRSDLSPYALLRDDLARCLKLDRVDLAGIVFQFSGFPSENPDMTGYGHLGPIIRALETNLTLRSVKLSAIFDSSEALKSQLPENC